MMTDDDPNWIETRLEFVTFVFLKIKFRNFNWLM